jgi:hypothetical protein
VDELRASLERMKSAGTRAHKLGEMIEKHGPDEWLQPLAEELGPWVQMQIGDLASYFEIMKKYFPCASSSSPLLTKAKTSFYEWESPFLTAQSLFFFVVCFLVSVLTSMEYCVKIVYLILGMIFFVSWPISSCHPQYRFLVSPFRWIFWGIQTHAEWAFAQLRREAQESRERIIARKVEESWLEDGRYKGVAVPESEASEEEEEDEDDWQSAHEVLIELEEDEVLASFTCRYGLHIGKLNVNPGGVCFESLRGRVHWRKEWWEFVEMQKVHFAPLCLDITTNHSQRNPQRQRGWSLRWERWK